MTVVENAGVSCDGPVIRDAPRNVDAIYRRVSFRILPLLLVCYIFAYLDRVNVGFAKLQMQDALHLSEAAYGFGAGVFFLGYVLFEIPSNLLMMRIGARRTIGRIMVLWGMTSSAMLFVQGRTGFYALRFLLGVFEAGFAPGMILYLTFWYSGHRMARVIAVVMLAGPIGSAIGGPASTLAMTALDGRFGLAGWQWLFLLEGFPCIPLGILAFVVLDKGPEEARWLTSAERQMLACELRTDRGGAAATFREAFRDRRLFVLAPVYFCIISGIYTMSFWLPTILRESGVADTMTLGLYSSLPFILAAGFMTVWARSSDQQRERRWHSAVMLVAGAGFLAVAASFPGSLTVSLPAISLATACIWAGYTVFWAIPSDFLRGTAAAGGIACINSIGLLGGFFSPTLIGAVKDATGSLQGGLYAMVVLLAVGGIGLLLFPKSAPVLIKEPMVAGHTRHVEGKTV